MALQIQPPDAKFTVFIRLPFPRGDFVDPPPVEWNAAKDQALWDILSRPAKDDINWKALADKFDVTLQFLLQQAAWLYDRQLSQVRAQMRKVGTTHSNSPSPLPGSVAGSTALGGQPMKAVPGTGSRMPIRLSSHQKDTLPQQGSVPRRTSSTSTVNQTKVTREPLRNETPTAETKEPRHEPFCRRSSATRREQVPAVPIPKSPTVEEQYLSSSSSESESDDEDQRGPRFKRFGKFSIHRAGLRDDEDDEEDSPAFLPLSRGTEQPARNSSGQDLNATLRLNNEQKAAQRRRAAGQSPALRNPVTAESSASSTSSGVPVSLPQAERRRNQTLSPGATGDLPRLSPRRSATSGRDTSDGTPSMGSSFSDLDDASVTQSALEEALMSNMQHGGMASRMSTISQALRSRYL